MRKFCAFLAVLALSGCVSTYKQDALTTPVSKLLSGKSVVIATPENGSYSDKVYSTSGKTTATAVQSAFAHHANNVVVSAECRDLDCLKNAYPSGYDYFVVPQILHWEDRATEWSGIRDKLEIKLTVYDAVDWRVLASNVITGKSKWATFGGDHPQDLLPHPLAEYVSTLY
jgi:hypothetical protein